VGKVCVAGDAWILNYGSLGSFSKQLLVAMCKKCGFKADRDSVGAINIWFRALQACAGAPGSPQRAPAVKDETRQSGGTKREGVKKVIRDIHITN
jgi:hypothetical protein